MAMDALARIAHDVAQRYFIRPRETRPSPPAQAPASALRQAEGTTGGYLSPTEKASLPKAKTKGHEPGTDDGYRLHTGGGQKKPRASQTAEQEELASYVNSLYEQGRIQQRKEHPKWYLSVCYMAGRQYVWYNPDTGLIDEIPRSHAWDIRIPFNRIKPIVEQVVGLLLSSAPRWLVTPCASTEAAYLSARGWQRWFDYIWQTEEIEDKLRDEALIWMVAAGRGWTRVLWDPHGGNRIRIPDEGEPAGEGEGGSVLDGLAGPDPTAPSEVEVSEGKITLSCPSPFNIFTDPSSRPWGPFRWLLECSYCHRQEVEELYGVELEPEPEVSVTQNLSRRVMAGLEDWGDLLWGSSSGSGREKAPGTGLYKGADVQEMVLVKELWVAPNEQYPQGRYVVVCNQQVLKEIENPYGCIPYVPFVWFPRLGSKECDGLVNQLIPVQDALNRTHSRQLAILNYHGAPPWLVEESTVVDESMFSDRPNNIILWRNSRPGAAPPMRLTPPNLTANFERTIMLLERQMEEISGLGDASRGRNPDGSRSATMIRTLQASDARKMTNAVARYRRGLNGLAKLIMNVTKRFVTEDRLVPVIGLDGSATVHEFTRADIEHGFDVRVQTGTGLPLSVEERLKVVGDMVQMGLLSAIDPREKKWARRLLEFGDLASLIDDDEVTERARIHWENLQMLQGETIEARPYDTHEAHAEGVARFMRSPEAQSAFREQPDLEQVFQAHLDKHIDWLNSEQTQVPFSPTQASPAPGEATAGAGGALPGPVGDGQLESVMAGSAPVFAGAAA